ncbi:hypothetical protein [Actinoplanes sp. URMC 104]|uniref:hypothetical protein n=1 Tax=Actinoplanes sp. URMC 104 TaxID=3423409 RepID=UPI003F1A9422
MLIFGILAAVVALAWCQRLLLGDPEPGSSSASAAERMALENRRRTEQLRAKHFGRNEFEDLAEEFDLPYPTVEKWEREERARLRKLRDELGGDSV